MKKIGDISYSTEDILLGINSYEDIFSDFDPRPYSLKALSGDFLSECKKVSEDKKQVNLKFLIPKKERNLKDEAKIKRRLKEHFKKHTRIKKKKIFDTRLFGFIWFVLGCIMMIMCAFFLNYKGPFWFNIVITIASPSGWFFLWEGLGKILIKAKEDIPDYVFNKKMANAEIIFENSK
jgi:hypothetical protein